MPQQLFDLILPHLKEPVGPDANGSYLCWCTFHADGEGKPPHQKNLSVHPEKGFICFACDAKGGLRKLAEHYGVKVERRSAKTSKTVCTYRYEDEDRALLYEIVRQVDDQGKKNFPCRRPDGKGGWVYNLKGSTLR